MAKETRKLQRAANKADAKQDSKANSGPDYAGAAQSQALSAESMRSMFVRLGLMCGGAWLVGGLIAAMTESTLWRSVALGTPAAVTVVLVGVAVWAVRRARSAQGVASVLAGVRSEEDRKMALRRLDSEFKTDDAAAIFARAQLQMQDSPREALETLEQINLNKVMATIADEARAQRGMIHLLLGEATQARDLSDHIDLSRHQDSRSKAMMSAVIAESWARTGQAKKAAQVLEPFNPEDDLFESVRPQLYRARAFVHAYCNNPKEMKKALRKIAQIDARILGGLLAKRTHPLLQKEAKQLLEKSGQVRRQVQVQR